MKRDISLADVLALTPAERIALVEQIWDSLEAAPQAVELTDADRAELDQRLDAYARDPGAGAPWDRRRLRGST